MLGIALLLNTVFATVVLYAVAAALLRATFKRPLSRIAYSLSFLMTWITNSFVVGQAGYRIGGMPPDQAQIYYLFVPATIATATVAAFYWMHTPKEKQTNASDGYSERT
jgi:hypothetical protein